MRSKIIAIIAITAIALFTARAEEKTNQWDSSFDLKPTLLNATDAGDWAGAVRWRGKLDYDYSPWRGKMTAFAMANTRGTWATDPHAHSENMTLNVNAGLAWQLQEPAKLGDSPPIGERDPDAPANTPPVKDGHRWGRIELSGKVGFESDQSMDNYALTYGPQLGYFHNNERGLWPLMPSVYLDYERVQLLKSSYYQSLGLNDNDSFFRLGAEASWQMPVGTWLSSGNKYISPIGAIINLNYSISHDAPTAVKVQDRDESFYFEAGLNYDLTSLKSKWLRSVYVTVANGRIAPAVENKTMIYVGVVLNWPEKKAKN